MLVLLGISTLTLALVPPPGERRPTTTSSTSPRTAQLPRGGKLRRATIDAGEKRPQPVKIRLGDQLSLAVRSERSIQVEIPRLGLLEDAAPLSPARFDILAERTGDYEVRGVQPPRPLGTIEVHD